MSNARNLTKLFFRSIKSRNSHSYNPQADFNWIVNQSKLAWLELAIDIPVNTILNEIKNIEHLFVNHRDQYSEHAGWQSFCLHGKSYDATREDEYYNDLRPYVWTNEAVELMPKTVKFFKEQWPNQSFARVRVMKLEPNGYINIHQDEPLPGSLNPVNIAITNPEDCKFGIEDFGCVPFNPGKSFMLNVAYRHAVINNSNETRYHIIVHHNNDDAELFKELVHQSYHNNMYL